MKKQVGTAILLTLILGVSIGIEAFAANKATLIVNGKSTKTDIKSINGVNYIPLRSAAELLDGDIKYDKNKNTYTITKKKSENTASSESFDYIDSLNFVSEKSQLGIQQITSFKAKNGKTYYHGFVGSGNMNLTYDIKGKYKRFEATLISEPLDVPGYSGLNAQLTIYIDGTKAYEREIGEFSKETVNVSLDLKYADSINIVYSGIKTVSLVNPRLVR